MQDLVIQFLKDINIGQLLAMGIMFWYFYNRLDTKIKEVGTRIDKLSDKVEDVDRRLCRIEGSLATQGHCLFNQSSCEKKVE